jgi:hypothetical protein
MKIFPYRGISWVITLMALSTTLVGQTVRTGRVEGTITDETGGTLPGVTVALTSPAVQVPQVTRVSDGSGEYQFVDLPPGTYRLVYELPGFTVLVREEIRLTTGFTARVDVSLDVGGVDESITVSGLSPVVDVVNTRGGTTVLKEMIAAIPNNQNYQDVMLLAAGVQIAGPPLTGDTGLPTLAAQFAPKTYGQVMRTTNTVEGIVVVPNEAPDFTSLEEVDIRTFGNSAEVDSPGAAIHLIVKSGGNDFHGQLLENGQHERFQSTNVDDELRAQGISEGNAIRFYNDFAASLGGPIVRDKLWFYGSFRDVRTERTSVGYARATGPDGTYGTIDDIPGRLPATSQNATAKLSYQATDNHRFVGFGARNPVIEQQSGSGRFVPFESSHILNQTSKQGKVEWIGSLTSRLLVSTMYAESGFTAARAIQDISLSTPNRRDLETGIQTGASYSSIGDRTPWRKQLSGRADYYPAGSLAGTHEISAGYHVRGGTFRNAFPNQQAGGYRLVYDSVDGVAHQPIELHTRNYPVDGTVSQNLYALFVSDTWRPATRLTLNLGLRWERNVNWVDQQVKVQGPFGPSGNIPRVDAGSFTELGPRVGVAFDVAGDGKTVAKGTYGKYHHQWARDYNVGFAQYFNQNTITNTVYRWRDQDGNDDYTPGEVNLDPNGPDFLSVSGATNNVVNPDMEMTTTHEATVSVERQLSNSMSIRGLYVYKKEIGQIALVNVLRPFSAYNQELTRRDPGPDGVLGNADDGGMVTFYDYDPALRGSRFVERMLVNAKDRSDSFQNFEITLNKRLTGNLFTFSSFLATKFHRWLDTIAETPNNDIFPLDETWEFSYRLAAGYQIPFGINVSTLYQAYQGIAGLRTYRFRRNDPDGAAPLPSAGSINIRMEPYGSRRGDIRHILNLRGQKRIVLDDDVTLTINLDAFNLLNSNVAWGRGGDQGSTSRSAGIDYTSGPTFGYVTSIVTPRVLRLGMVFEF